MSSDLNEMHDLHLSKSEISYNRENQALEITLHLFIDDLELALESYGQKDLLICTEKENPNAEAYIAQYIEENLEIAIDDNEQPIHFLGKEASEDLMGIWCYLEVTEVSTPQSISATIGFFNELYDDQKNVLQIKYDSDQQEYFLLNKNKENAQLSISHE